MIKKIINRCLFIRVDFNFIFYQILDAALYLSAFFALVYFLIVLGNIVFGIFTGHLPQYLNRQ